MHGPKTHTGGPRRRPQNKSMQLCLKTFHPVLAPHEPTTHPRPAANPASAMLDKEKVDARVPDVTNQTDKEPARPWTAAQLWPQLCTVVRARSFTQGEEGGEREGGGGAEKGGKKGLK